MQHVHERAYADGSFTDRVLIDSDENGLTLTIDNTQYDDAITLDINGVKQLRKALQKYERERQAADR